MRSPRTTHILPGCWVHFSTARRESAPRADSKTAQARWIVAAVRKGLVGRSRLKASHVRPRSRRAVRACSSHSMSGDVSPENAGGRRNGTSAP
jgi:hypothetical protein